MKVQIGNQTIEVPQGVEVKIIDEEKHKRIGKRITLEGFQKRKKGEVQFDFTFIYRETGIIHVKVVERETDKVLFDKDLNNYDSEN